MTAHQELIYRYIDVIRCRLDALGPQIDDLVSPEEIVIRRYALAMVTFLDIPDQIERKRIFDLCIGRALIMSRTAYLNALYTSQEELHG